MQRKILVMGLPGAGKTALATALAPLLNAVVFNADAVRANLAYFGTAVSLTMSDHAPPCCSVVRKTCKQAVAHGIGILQIA